MALLCWCDFWSILLSNLRREIIQYALHNKMNIYIRWWVFTRYCWPLILTSSIISGEG